MTWKTNVKSFLRRSLIFGSLGILLTVVVAWSCATWSPVTSHRRPAEPSNGGYPALEPGPTGEMGWWSIRVGWGWSEAAPLNARGAEGDFSYWNGSGTPAYREAGWPFLALSSIVEPVHSKGSSELLTGWKLPWLQILRRGFQTDHLPKWCGAKFGRRIPLVPKWQGFFMDCVFYSLFSVSILRAISLFYSKSVSVREGKDPESISANLNPQSEAA